MRSFSFALMLACTALASPAFAKDTLALPAIGPPEAATEVTSVAALPSAATVDSSAFKFTVSLVIPKVPRQPRFKSPYIFDAIVVRYPEWALFGAIWKKASLSPTDQRAVTQKTLTTT